MAEKQTITKADVGVLDLSKDNPKVTLFPRTLMLSEIKAGDVVVFVDQSLNVHPRCTVDSHAESNNALAGKTGVVIGVDANAPGKVVAVCLKDKVAFGHSCDGRVPNGQGAYAMPDHLYTVNAWSQHRELATAAVDEQKKIDAMVSTFMGSAK